MDKIDYKDLLEIFLHEVNSLNTIIKGSAELLSKSTKNKMDNKAVIHHSNVILENSFILATQFDIINYLINPEFIKIERPDKRNLFGKFFKSVISFKRLAKNKNITINLTGEANSLLDMYPVIDTLPILILDNAIKYSIMDSDVDIDFFEDSDSIEIRIENIGPCLNEEEIENVCNKGFRGEEAIKTEKPGYGFGLSFLKQICVIHNATCKISSGNCKFQSDGVKYSDFKMVLDFPKR